MTDDLDKLAALLRDETPAPRNAAKMAAIAAGMQAFEENSKKIQGTEQATRPIHNRPETERGFLEGFKVMINKFSGRQMMLGTASFATIAVAIFVTQNMDFGTRTNGLPPVIVDAETSLGSVTSSADQGGTPVFDQLAQNTYSDSPSSLATPVPANESPAIDIATPVPRAQEAELGLAADASPVENNVIAQAPVSNTMDRRRAETDDMSPASPPMIAQSDMVSGALATQGFVANQETVKRIADDTSIIVQPENHDQFVGESVSPLKVTLEEPVSTFSIDVDTASYAFVRRQLLSGYLPDPDAVRTEELINYFEYNYALPIADQQPFAPQATVFPTPWNDDTLLLHIGIQGYDIAVEDRPPVNLVFLIDTSGSMNDPQKLPLLIQSFRLLLGELNSHDSVAIVTYAGSAGVVLEPTPATEMRKIMRSLTRLAAGGSTAGQAGLQQAYALAEEMADDGDTSRVILATDGDFNVGISDRDELKKYIEDKRDTGVYLSILGFGQGNYNDALMQTLAQNGNGTAAYIDTLAEAQKVLVDQIGGALFTIGQDVKIQVEFNPAEIAEYRLIGYETRALAREDFNNDAVDAGDIGSGHQVTAIYEITPVGSPAISVDPLRFGQPDALPEGNGELAFLKLRYKLPGESTSNLITTPVMHSIADQLPLDVIFSTAVASFGQLLRGDTRLGDWDYDDVVAMAQTARGDDPFGYRSEFIRLVRLAETAQ